MKDDKLGAALRYPPFVTSEEERSMAALREYIDTYMADLKAVLLTMDEEKIRAFHQKHNPQKQMPTHPEMFWGTVHKLITGFKTIDIETRRKSKAWLTARGYRSYDDGDL